jgi:micrococcal nuclease
MTRLRYLLAVLAVVVLAGCTFSITGETIDRMSGTETPGPIANGSNISVPGGERVAVEVVDVVDGDTIDVRMPDGSEDTVRLVGVDTPEVHVENDPAEFEGVPDTTDGATCLREAGHDASAYLDSRLSTGNVSLVFDPNTDRRGGYDRLLAYVYVGEHNVNYDLVASGNARVYDTDFTLRTEFDGAEQRARTNRTGLWSCQTAG